MKNLLKIPSLIIVLIVFNVMLSSDPSGFDPRSVPSMTIEMPSGGTWYAGYGIFLQLGALLLLGLEILKHTRFPERSALERTISLLILVVLVIEFVAWEPACNHTCAVLIMISFLNVICGYVVCAAKTKREFDLGGIH